MKEKSQTNKFKRGKNFIESIKTFEIKQIKRAERVRSVVAVGLLMRILFAEM